MTIEQALDALAQTRDADASVIVIRNEGGELMAAPVLAVVLDDESHDVSLLTGEFTEEDAALDEATTVADVRDALREIGDDRRCWPLYATDSDDVSSSGSIVGFSTDAEVEIFAFLQGPKSAWDGD